MKHSENILALLVLAFVIATTKAQTSCTADDTNATYTNISSPACTSSPYHVNCQVRKTCNVGYIMTNGVVMNMICNKTTTKWDPPEDMCISCEKPNYGKACSSIAHCSTSCEYNNTEGCVFESSSHQTWEECILENVAINISESNIEKLIGKDRSILITLRLNIPEDNVNVSVTFNYETIMLNSSNGGQVYEYYVDVERHTDGVYMFIADTGFGLDKENVSVSIYEPVEIIGIYKQESEIPIIVNEIVEITAESMNISYTCKADGIEDPDVEWHYEGVAVSKSEMNSRIFQIKNVTTFTSTLYLRPGTGVKMNDSGRYTCYATNSAIDTFIDVQTLNIVVRESGYEATEHVKKQDFLIAVCLLGFFLLVAVVSFICFALWIKRQQVSFKENSNNQQKGKITNRYEHHLPSNSQRHEERSEFDNVQRISSPAPTSPTTAQSVQRDARAPTTAYQPSNTRHTTKLPPPQARKISELPGMQTHRPEYHQSPRGVVTHENNAFNSDEVIYEPDDSTYDEPQQLLEQENYEEPMASTRKPPIYDDSIPY